MKLIVAVVVTLFSNISLATVTYKAADCPEAFEGQIKEIVSEVGPSEAFSTQKVIFENLQTLKGDPGQTVAINILENGPFKIEIGKKYRVQLRNENLCWIERL